MLSCTLWKIQPFGGRAGVNLAGFLGRFDCAVRHAVFPAHSDTDEGHTAGFGHDVDARG